MNSLPLRSFRFNCKEERLPPVRALLAAQGFEFSADSFFGRAARLERSPFALGSSAAARFGYLYIQDRASMLPPLALAPRPGDAVLDMCAAPGGKTSLSADLAGPAGFVLGCEPNTTRLATLRRNLSLLNLPQCATLCAPAEALPLPAGGFARIQLDPPCSGWGTVEKNPRVLRLWKGDKVRPLIDLQRKLLREAFRLCAPGGWVVYSTCTTNTAENEEQMLFARDEAGFLPAPLEPPAGFACEEARLPGVSGIIRTSPGPDGQGFFVALLRKPENAPVSADGPTDGPAGVPGSLGHAATAVGTGAGVPGFISGPAPGSGRAPAFAGKGSGPRGLAKSRGRTDKRPPRWEPVAPGDVESPGCDPRLLPPGEVRAYNGTAHFLPAASLALMPENLSWKGFPLGKLAPDGRVRVHPALRFLMPEAGEARDRGAAVLDLEDVAPLEALLRGESLPAPAPAAEACLYFRGLPLCRLPLKNGRAVLPGLF